MGFCNGDGSNVFLSINGLRSLVVAYPVGQGNARSGTEGNVFYVNLRDHDGRLWEIGYAGGASDLFSKYPALGKHFSGRVFPFLMDMYLENRGGSFRYPLFHDTRDFEEFLETIGWISRKWNYRTNSGKRVSVYEVIPKTDEKYRLFVRDGKRAYYVVSHRNVIYASTSPADVREKTPNLLKILTASIDKVAGH